MSVFKSCDIRGVYGPDLDADFALHLGRVVGQRVAGRDIVVGGDLRVSTPALKAALIEGLVVSGAHVLDVGQVPTPTLYFAKHHLEAFGGIMVTASHNPARYNGFKLMLGDMPITPDGLQGIKREMASREFSVGQGAAEQLDIVSDYKAMLKVAFPVLESHSVVIDAGNGSLSEIAPDALRETGQNVVELYCQPDGTFPSRDPNPSVPSHLADLAESVREHGAELGVAYDGDGDRVIFVDSHGHVIPAERVFVLFVRHVLQYHPGAGVVYDLKSSRVVHEEIERLGGVPHMERSGHAFIKRRMLVEDALLGGEISGHCFFGETQGDDALYATLYLLRILDELGLGFSEAIATVPAYAATPDVRLPCPPDQVREILAELEVSFSDLPITKLDGVRIQFERGWALARLSVTEPLITMRFEADDEQDLAEIQELVRGGSRLLGEIWSL